MGIGPRHSGPRRTNEIETLSAHFQHSNLLEASTDSRRSTSTTLGPTEKLLPFLEQRDNLLIIMIIALILSLNLSHLVNKLGLRVEERLLATLDHRLS